MQTFTADEFRKQPAKVYRAADKDGEVKINHDRYNDLVFVLSTKARNSLNDINYPIEAIFNDSVETLENQMEDE